METTSYGKAWRAFRKQNFGLCSTTYYSTVPITCTRTEIHRTQTRASMIAAEDVKGESKAHRVRPSSGLEDLTKQHTENCQHCYFAESTVHQAR